MASLVECRDSTVTVSPYEPRLFEWNTPEGKAFFSSTINRLLQSIGDNVVLDGLTCIPEYTAEDGLSVSVTPGYAIHSSTLINIKSTYKVTLGSISSFSPAGYFCVYMDFQCLRNTYEQKPSLGLVYVNNLGDPNIPWIHSRYGLLLDIYKFADGAIKQAEETFIVIEDKPYYRAGYDTSNMHLAKYISHFVKDVVMQDLNNVEFTGDVTVGRGLRVKGDAVFDKSIVAHDMELAGDLEVKGGDTFLNTDNTFIKDPMLKLNVGERGLGITSNQLHISGLQVDRGQLKDAMLFFDDSDDTWKVGFENEPAQALLSSDDISITGVHPVVVDKQKNKQFYKISIDSEFLEELKQTISVRRNDELLTERAVSLNFNTINHEDAVSCKKDDVYIDLDKLDPVSYYYESKKNESVVRIKHNLNTYFLFVRVYAYNEVTGTYRNVSNGRVIFEDKNTIVVKVQESTLLRVLIHTSFNNIKLNNVESVTNDWVVHESEADDIYHSYNHELFSKNIVHTYWRALDDASTEAHYVNLLAPDVITDDTYEVILSTPRRLKLISETFTEDNPAVCIKYFDKPISPNKEFIIEHNLNSEDIDVYMTTNSHTVYIPVRILDENRIEVLHNTELSDLRVIIVAYGVKSEDIKLEPANRAYVYKDGNGEPIKLAHNLDTNRVIVQMFIKRDASDDFTIMPCNVEIIDNNNIIVEPLVSYEEARIAVFSAITPRATTVSSSDREYVYAVGTTESSLRIEHGLGTEDIRVTVWDLDEQYPKLITPVIAILDENTVYINLAIPRRLKVLIRSFPDEKA